MRILMWSVGTYVSLRGPDFNVRHTSRPIEYNDDSLMMELLYFILPSYYIIVFTSYLRFKFFSRIAVDARQNFIL